MKKSISIALQVLIFAALASMGILYILNQSPVENLGEYEKQEMVKPNRDRSVIDQFFSKDKKNTSVSDGDDISLMGGSGRYDEVRIGKSAEE